MLLNFAYLIDVRRVKDEKPLKRKLVTLGAKKKSVSEKDSGEYEQTQSRKTRRLVNQSLRPIAITM